MRAFLRTGLSFHETGVSAGGRAARQSRGPEECVCVANAVLYFVSVVIGAKAKVNLIFTRVCERAKRFYGIAVFFQHVVADGIHRLLFASPSGPLPTPPPSDPDQLLLAFAKPPT